MMSTRPATEAKGREGSGLSGGDPRSTSLLHTFWICISLSLIFTSLSSVGSGGVDDVLCSLAYLMHSGTRTGHIYEHLIL